MATCFDAYSDAVLLEHILQGDQKAFRVLYDRHGASIYHFVRQKLSDREEARDIVQEVFLSFWQNRERLNAQTDPIAYLFSSAKYKIIDCYARNKVRRDYIENHHIDAAIGWSVSDNADRLLRERETRNRIDREVAALPTKMQSVFRLSREEHLSHKEIATRIDISEATVKKHVNNALKVLRSRLASFLF